MDSLEAVDMSLEAVDVAEDVVVIVGDAEEAVEPILEWTVKVAPKMISNNFSFLYQPSLPQK